MLHSDITEKIIKAFYKVNNTLGFGFSHRDGFAIRKGLPRVIKGNKNKK